MFKVRTPFYNTETAPIDYDAMVSQHFGDSVDEQPDEDSEEPVEEMDEQEAPDDEVEEPTDEQEEQEEVTDEEEKPAFDDETEIDLGEGRQPVKLAELKQGYLRQSDYTKKTQALADERKTFEAEREQLQPVMQMDQFFRSNPFVFQQVTQAINQFLQTGDLPISEALQDAEYGKYINHYMAQANQLQKELDDLRAKYGELEFTGTFKELKSDLKAEYGDLLTDEYLTTLQDRAKAEKLPMSVVREIADGHLTKLKLQETQKQTQTATKKAEAKTIQKIQEKRNALPPQPRAQGQRPSTPTKSVEDMSWEELARQAAEEMRR